jgi:hypothetical protein
MRIDCSGDMHSERSDTCAPGIMLASPVPPATRAGRRCPGPARVTSAAAPALPRGAGVSRSASEHPSAAWKNFLIEVETLHFVQGASAF